MTTRIPQSYAARLMLGQVIKNRADVNKYSQEISTGLKVQNPGETRDAGTISQFQEMLGRIEGYSKRITSSTSMLTFQDDLLAQSTDIIARAKEVAAQASNDSNGPTIRSQMAAEVFQLRDQMVTIANTTYQGRYIFGGTDDDDPPYDAATYTAPAIGAASQRYVFDAEAGTDVQKNVQVTDDLSLTVTTQGNTLFDTTIQALERLGRSLEGYQTTLAAGVPTGAGVAYTFPTDFSLQSADIRAAMDQLDVGRQQQIMPERVSIGARIKRLETAESLLKLNKTSAEDVLAQMQNADVVESASNLTQAQTAFEASLQVTLRALNLSILDYI